MRHKNMIAMKHWDIFKELKSEVDDRCLFEMSAIEQNLACREEHDVAKEEVTEAVAKLLSMDCIKDAQRLVMLYHLRYEKSKSCITEQLVHDLVTKGGLRADDAAMVKKVVAYGGSSARSGPGAKLMKNENVQDKMFSMMRGKLDIFVGDDVSDLIQHKPLIAQILKDLQASKLSAGEYPEINLAAESKPKEIIVFIVGGSTYAEAAFIQQWNLDNPGCKVMLGSTHIHNSSSFIEEVDSFNL